MLPKFNKVMETRKTTEAEEVMAAIRTEQEQRCAFNKKYAESFSQLGDVLASNDTNNYTYSLTREGVTASSKGSYSYNLQMPSFADGRICCDTQAPGNECAKLNKDYPACHELIARADYMASASECRAPCNPPEGNTTYTEACEEGYSGNRTYTWNNATCSYSETSNTCVCTPTHSGQETYNESCGAGYSGSKTYTWSYSSCSYSETNNTCTCTPTHNGQVSYSESCGTGYSGNKYYEWSYSSCSYIETSNTCEANECSGSETYISDTVHCGCNNQGYAKYKCNNGHWNNDGCTVQSTCECSAGDITYNGSCGCGGTNKYTCNNGFWSTTSTCVNQQSSQTDVCKSCCGSPYYYKTRSCSNGQWGAWDESDCNKTCPSCGSDGSGTSGTGNTTSHQCNAGDPKPSQHGQYCCKSYGWTDGGTTYDVNGNVTGNTFGKTSWDEWNSRNDTDGLIFSFYYTLPPGATDPNAGRTAYCTSSGHYNCSCKNHSWECPCQ